MKSVSRIIITVGNAVAFAGGIALIIVAALHLVSALDKVPDSIYDEATTLRDINYYFLIGLGSLLTAVAAFGFFAFGFRSRCLMVTYMAALGCTLVFQTTMGIVLIIYKTEETFPIFDGEIQEQISIGMQSYCEYVPVTPATQLQFNAVRDTLIVPLFNLVDGLYSVPRCTVERYVDNSTCISLYQDQCQAAVVRWFNERYFWVGIALVSAALVELIIIAISIYFYLKHPKVVKETGVMSQGGYVRILPWAKTRCPLKVWCKQEGEKSEVTEIKWDDKWIGDIGQIMRGNKGDQEELKNHFWVRMDDGSWLFLRETLLVLVPDEDVRAVSIEMQSTKSKDLEADTEKEKVNTPTPQGSLVFEEGQMVLR